MNRSLARVSTAVFALVCIVSVTPSEASAIQRRWVQGRDSNFHYGVSAYINVEPVPMGFDSNVAHQVTSIWAYTTDEKQFIEVGHGRDNDSDDDARAFIVVCRDRVVGPPMELGVVPTYSNQRYHIGYSKSSGTHYVWWNNEIVYSTRDLPRMTSSWPGTNVELAHELPAGDLSYHENTGHFWGLKYKTEAWGVWQPFSGVAQYYDNDPLHRFKRISATEHSVIPAY